MVLAPLQGSSAFLLLPRACAPRRHSSAALRLHTLGSIVDKNGVTQTSAKYIELPARSRSNLS